MIMEWKLGNEIKCVVHYKNLQLYLSLEMKLTKVSRILKFKQHDIHWLKIYIDFNIVQKMNWWLTVIILKQWKIYEKE